MILMVLSGLWYNKYMDPSQYNDFGGAPGATISSGTGDVVLPASEKKSRKGLIIGLVIGLVVILSVGIAALVLLSGSNEENIVFDDLRSYLEKGTGFQVPANEENTETESGDATEPDGETSDSAGDNDTNNDNSDETSDGMVYDSIYAVTISSEEGNVIESYYEGLNTRLSAFGKIGKVDSGLMASYQNTMRILSGVINYQSINDTIISKVQNDGEEVAKQYLDDSVLCSEDGELGNICGLMNQYYERYFSETMFYAKVGCLVDGMRDATCALEHYNGEELLEDSDFSGVADGYLGQLQSDNVKMMLSLAVRASNEELAEVMK